MSTRKDIITPEGYFEDLQDRLLAIPRQAAAPRGIRRLTPYAAFAASIAAAVLIGNFVLRQTAVPAEDDGWTYLSYLTQVLDPDGGSLVDGDAWAEESALSEDDIVNYLLADGISVEHLNYVHDEEDY